MLVHELIAKLNSMPQMAEVYSKYYDEWGDDCHDGVDEVFVDSDHDVILCEER